MGFKLGEWYVLYVRSRHERKVEELLHENNIEAFAPMIKTVKQWSDRKKTVLKPLIPSYVFVKINSTKDFSKALSVNGACMYIRFGAEYAKVTENEIDKIKILIGTKDVIDVKADFQIPAIGDIKEISYGPLSGLRCKILENRNINKILVSINSLRLNIVATIPSSFLQQPVQLGY
ncbi:UpxY family transcription antiterminator [Aquimarina spongiae]|uniref:Transcription antitermination factor NusG n=1 Tax=Aquimarina spongiae TaxID=570521 RepID=A0A1M6LHV8_9FLAO|nr:UpxY family transcription antiterminator [Aquimarina spongiae]SHJ70757.1 Transcription antitermination factor NusG [Aquimarina spongiae]